MTKNEELEKGHCKVMIRATMNLISQKKASGMTYGIHVKNLKRHIKHLQDLEQK